MEYRPDLVNLCITPQLQDLYPLDLQYHYEEFANLVPNNDTTQVHSLTSTAAQTRSSQPNVIVEATDQSNEDLPLWNFIPDKPSPCQYEKVHTTFLISFSFQLAHFNFQL